MRIALLTTGRQDWGVLRSTCSELRRDPAFELCLLVGGMHCSELFGRTERLITEDGFEIAERLRWIADRQQGAGQQAAEALAQVGAALRRRCPDALLLVGDRFETAAAALAATLELVPIVHLHGGEETEGAFDNSMRHAITKLAHLHLVSHREHARRVELMGEHPGTIHVVGAPALDNLRREDLAGRAELERHLGLELTPPVVIVTLHPTTLGGEPVAEVSELVAAMDRVDATYVVTLPNTDPGHETLRRALLEACDRPRRAATEALGERTFFGLLRLADAMLGNSSSGLIEAPALGLPAVNVGERQLGRMRGENVIDVPADRGPIEAGLRRALDPVLRERLEGATSPFGDGRSAKRILEILRSWTPPDPPRKIPPGGRST